jgi:hypothetical protein
MSTMQPDNVVNLSRFRADATRALGRRGQALLMAADLPQQVAAMAPLEFYYVVKELGVEDGQAILQHGSAEQLQACCDMDCWDKDDFAPVELDAWLAGFMAQGKEALAHAFLQIDPELQVLFLAESLAIYDVRSEPVPEMPDSVPYKQTLDAFFALYAVTEEREVPPFLLVDALYAHSIDTAFALLTAAKWEVLSETTETAYQFRRGRLQDMGFVDPADAARLFAPPPRQLTPTVSAGVAAIDSPSGLRLPGLYAEALVDTSTRLGRALAHVSAAHMVARLQGELVALINMATVAYGNATRDLGGVLRVATYVRDTLSLGLEVLLHTPGEATAVVEAGAEGDVSGYAADEADLQAAALVTQRPLVHVFQAGFAAVRPLHQAARTLVADPVVATWLDAGVHPDDDPQGSDRAFLRSLAQGRPLWAGWDPLRPEQTRAWHSRADVAQCQARLDTLAGRLL